MKKDISEITKKLEQGVKDVFESDRYKDYLSFMTKFHNYSINNIVLIMMQNPEASLVAGYKAWQTKFHRQVRKGEKAITILAPCTHKKVIEQDGEQKEVVWTSFRAVKVFDISQTDGEDVPDILKPLAGDVKNYEDLKNRLVETSPVDIEFKPIKKANGYFHIKDKRIVVKSGMSEEQTIKTMIHEISHAMLHNADDGSEKDADNNTKEVQAESVAYVVCQMLGIDSSEYSFGYIAGWSRDRTIKELSASIEAIRTTATDLVNRIRAI